MLIILQIAQAVESLLKSLGTCRPHFLPISFTTSRTRHFVQLKGRELLDEGIEVASSIRSTKYINETPTQTTSFHHPLTSILMALEFLSKIPISSIYQVLEPSNDFTPTL